MWPQSPVGDPSAGAGAAGAGDFNGDGFADVVIGDPEDDQVAIYLGSIQASGSVAALHKSLALQQLRGGGSTVASQPFGLSYDLDEFQVRMRGTHPDGRGRVRLELEACPPGFDFGAPGCTRSTAPVWTDSGVGTSGVTLTHELTGLPVGTLFRWRARVQYAPLTVTAPGISAQPSPRHGRWFPESCGCETFDWSLTLSEARKTTRPP